MRVKLIVTLGLLLAFCFPLLAQIQPGEDTEQYDGLKYVTVARELALRGYQTQDPLYLMTAAQTLAEYPVKGNLQPDSILFENASYSPSVAGARTVELNPHTLLDDAVGMAGSDSLLIAMIERTREKVRITESLPRGRKFSPLISEFNLNSQGRVKLWATFNANEIAEVFVAGNGSTTIDLYLYDLNGKLLASDLKNIDDCYVSFTPSGTMQFRIEIKNNGTTDNKCLLMTN